MFKKQPSPAVGQGGGTQLEVRGLPRGRMWGALRVVLVAVLGLQLAYATSYPMGGDTHRSPLRRLSRRSGVPSLSPSARTGRQDPPPSPPTWSASASAKPFRCDFLKDITIKREIKKFREYRSTARACGYAFRVGVIREAHKAALLARDGALDIVVTECK